MTTNIRWTIEEKIALLDTAIRIVKTEGWPPKLDHALFIRVQHEVLPAKRRKTLVTVPPQMEEDFLALYEAERDLPAYEVRKKHGNTKVSYHEKMSIFRAAVRLERAGRGEWRSSKVLGVAICKILPPERFVSIGTIRAFHQSNKTAVESTVEHESKILSSNPELAFTFWDISSRKEDTPVKKIPASTIAKEAPPSAVTEEGQSATNVKEEIMTELMCRLSSFEDTIMELMAGYEFTIHNLLKVTEEQNQTLKRLKAICGVK